MPKATTSKKTRDSVADDKSRSSSNSSKKKKSAKRSKSEVSSVEATPEPEKKETLGSPAVTTSGISEKSADKSQEKSELKLPSQAPSKSQDQPTSTSAAAEYDDEDVAEDQNITIDPEYENYMRSKQEQSINNMQLLMEGFSPEQLARYETYRSAAFPKQAIRRILQQILGHSVSEKVAVVVGGVAKIFVGEVVEEARDIMEERLAHNQETDLSEIPIPPEFLREAYQRLRDRNAVPSTRFKKKFFLS